jgi:hypothetical protein
MDRFWALLRCPLVIATLLATSPAVGLAQQVRRIDVLVVLYTRSFSQTLTREQLERVHEEVFEFVDFYRTAAGDAVDIRLSLLQIDRELALAEVSEVAPGRYYLAREDIEDELVRLSMLDYEFDEVIALYAWNNANPEGAALAYGGGAVGPDGNFLGDAGYNSIGVFAWDPGRISQIMIHEVLHNIDDMFSMSGMPDGFLNSDEMSRNMPALLADRPGAFLPHYDDDEMISYAERERANRATYPWAMQLVYYGWMLVRTPREAWMSLDYGSIIDAGERRRGTRPLYERVFLSRANGEVYLPVVSGGGQPPVARAGTRESALERRTYRHTDFDGSTLFEGTYHAGWVALPGGADPVAVAVSGGSLEVVPIGLGDLAAPARLVAYARSVVATEGADSVTFEAEVDAPESEGVLQVRLREARFDAQGPAVEGGAVVATIAGDTLELEETEPGLFAFDVAELGMGRQELTLIAQAPGLAFAPRVVTVERRSPWRIWADSQVVAGIGTPLAITIRIGQDVGAREARVTARVGESELELRELTDGRYSVVLDEVMALGVDTIRVSAELPAPGGVEVIEGAIPIYVQPRGWIEVPRRIGASADSVITLEARVRDRMGRAVEGAALPLAVVLGPDLLSMTEEEPGLYRVRFQAPPGDHRIYVIGLEGRFERRVVSLQVR